MVEFTNIQMWRSGHRGRMGVGIQNWDFVRLHFPDSVPYYVFVINGLFKSLWSRFLHPIYGICH